MKKSLIALSILAASASVAQAQNVTVYGLLDTSAANVKSGAFSNTVLISGAHSTSRFGIRGSEDLGGGLRANFGMEAAVLSDSGYFGTTPTTTVAATNRIFGRGMSVGLSGNFGALDLGSLPSSANAFQGTYAAGIGGNYDVISARAAVYSASYATAWQDNSIRYTTPTVAGGLRATLRYAMGSSTTVSGATQTNMPGGTGFEGTTDVSKKHGVGQDINLSYTAGPLVVGAFQQSNNLQTSNTAKDSAKGAGVAYTVNPALRLGYAYLSYDPTNASAGDQRKAHTLALGYSVSPALLIGLYYAGVNVESATGDAKATIQSASAHYSLSKRTTAYGYYVKVSNQATSSIALGGLGQSGTSYVSPLPGIAAGVDPTALGVGIRHSF